MSALGYFLAASLILNAALAFELFRASKKREDQAGRYEDLIREHGERAIAEIESLRAGQKRLLEGSTTPFSHRVYKGALTPPYPRPSNLQERVSALQGLKAMLMTSFPSVGLKEFGEYPLVKVEPDKTQDSYEVHRGGLILRMDVNVSDVIHAPVLTLSLRNGDDWEARKVVIHFFLDRVDFEDTLAVDIKLDECLPEYTQVGNRAMTLEDFEPETQRFLRALLEDEDLKPIVEQFREDGVRYRDLRTGLRAARGIARVFAENIDVPMHACFQCGSSNVSIRHLSPTKTEGKCDGCGYRTWWHAEGAEE